MLHHVNGIWPRNTRNPQNAFPNRPPDWSIGDAEARPKTSEPFWLSIFPSTIFMFYHVLVLGAPDSRAFTCMDEPNIYIYMVYRNFGGPLCVCFSLCLFHLACGSLACWLFFLSCSPWPALWTVGRVCVEQSYFLKMLKQWVLVGLAFCMWHSSKILGLVWRSCRCAFVFVHG